MSAKLTPDEEEAYESYVHTPTESNAALVQLAREIYGTTGISSGSPKLDAVMIPTRMNWIRVWVGATSQGKTTMLSIVAFNEASRLVYEGRNDTHYVAYITYEEAVDTQELRFQRGRDYTMEEFWRGQVDVDRVIKGGITRPDLPLYFIGESMMKSNINSPPMTIAKCLAGLRAIAKVEGKLPSAIVLDYAQEIVVDLRAGTKRTERVIEAMKQVLRMGVLTKCAIELGAQARRTSLQNNPPLPEIDDIEWAHQIAEKATNIVGLWRPWTTHVHNQAALNGGIPIGDDRYVLTPNLTIFKPLKHRPGLIQGAIATEVNTDTLTINDNPPKKQQKQAPINIP